MTSYRFDCIILKKGITSHNLGFCFAENYTNAIKQIENLFNYFPIVEIKLYKYSNTDDQILLDESMNLSNTYYIKEGDKKC